MDFRHDPYKVSIGISVIMTRKQNNIITDEAWSQASRKCTQAKNLGKCNESSIMVKETIDADLGCEWTRNPDRVVDNEVKKRHVSKGLETIGAFFVGKENIKDSTCNVTAPDGTLVKP